MAMLLLQPTREQKSQTWGDEGRVRQRLNRYYKVFYQKKDLPIHVSFCLPLWASVLVGGSLRAQVPIIPVTEDLNVSVITDFSEIRKAESL